MLLADVFVEFRKMCLQNFKLHPCHYFSSLRLSLDTMFKMTGVELDLISDIDMYQFIEKGIRIAKSYYKCKPICKPLD